MLGPRGVEYRYCTEPVVVPGILVQVSHTPVLHKYQYLATPNSELRIHSLYAYVNMHTAR